MAPRKLKKSYIEKFWRKYGFFKMGVPDMLWIVLSEEIIYKGIIGFLLNFGQKIWSIMKNMSFWNFIVNFLL